MGGQTDYLGQMVHEHWHELHCMLTAVTGSSATAADLAQEVFVLAMRERLQPGPGARTWFRRAGRFLALNELRRRRPVPVAPEDIERMCEVEPAVVETDAGFDESLTALRLCMGELKESDRVLLAARYERRDPLEKVAAEQQQTVGYLKQRLFRIRARLRACIRRRMGASDGDEYAGTAPGPA
jgi:RNA polymerase sigma-70 factor (ECF subfamily)